MSDVFIIFSSKYLIYLLIVLYLIYLFLQGSSVKKRIAILSLFALPAAFIISRILSNFYYSTRPFVEQNFTPLISHAADNGFPSDHALLIFTLASAVFAFSKKWGVIFFILGIDIGLSRILAGIHSPLDILGSFLIGAGVVFICYKIIKLKLGK